MRKQHWRVGADLSQRDQKALLEAFPPNFKNVFCRSLTMAYKVTDDFQFSKEDIPVEVYGYHQGDGHEAILVKLGHAGVKRRPDGRLYAITLSTAEGVPPAAAGEIDPKKIKVLHNQHSFTVRFKAWPLWVTRPTQRDAA